MFEFFDKHFQILKITGKFFEIRIKGTLVGTL